MLGVTCLTIGVIQQVKSKLFWWTTSAQKVTTTHSVPHTECRVPITVVIIEHCQQNSILPVIHKRILGTVGGEA